jgi:hypothetical protein
VTLSTAEVEYVAATHATKECIWLHRLTGEILPIQSKSITLYCDNQATLKLMQGNNYHARTKHIDLCYHFIQDVVKKGDIKLQYCPMDDMMVDILTKVLPCWDLDCATPVGECWNQKVQGLTLMRQNCTRAWLVHHTGARTHIHLQSPI